jgi:hypothetical protein
MALTPGTRIGPYEIVDRLGAGGMGEVWRARDPRLERDVALKVLPEEVTSDPERRRRFEQEARAAGALSHPNVLTVHDVGTADAGPYLVTELYEGQTLRERLGGHPLPLRTAIDFARQAALGLAAAHERGIVHRDLKPENLFVVHDGTLKILDFGLAKVGSTSDAAAPADGTLPAPTATGTVLGSVGYMAPEQVRGQPADARSDLFSLGAIIFEMLTGQRAFGGPTAVEVGYATLNQDPPDLATARPEAPAAVVRAVLRCLEKNPAARFQTARDLAFHLEALGSGSAAEPGPGTLPIERPRRPLLPPSLRRPLRLAAAAAAVLGLAILAGFGLGRVTVSPPPPPTIDVPPPPAPPTWRQLSFRRGWVHEARFAPDGRTVIYSASWNGEAPEVYSVIPGTPESRWLLSGHTLAAVSPRGELAVFSRPTRLGHVSVATLSRVPLGGGTPREEVDNITAADFLPDGTLAVARWHSTASGTLLGHTTVEIPAGTVRYETTGVIGSLRASPDDARVAVVEHRSPQDDEGRVVVVSRAGQSRPLEPWFASVHGLVWSFDGSEIWVTGGARDDSTRAVYAIAATGKSRLVSQTPSFLTLMDRGPEGRVLIAGGPWGSRVVVRLPKDQAERDLTVLEDSYVARLSADGRLVLVSEWSAGAAGQPVVTYLRRTDGAPAVPLGAGFSFDLSPDGRLVLDTPYPRKDRVRLVPTGAGTTRELPRGPLEAVEGAWFLPDGRRIVIDGRVDGRRHFFLQDATGGEPQPLEGEPSAFFEEKPITPDGRSLLTLAPDGSRLLRPLGGGPVRVVKGIRPGDRIAGWSADGRSAYVRRTGEPFVAVVERVDLVSGAARPWRTLGPTDRSGRGSVGHVHVTPDGGTYAYQVSRALSTLYLVEGLR